MTSTRLEIGVEAATKGAHIKHKKSSNQTITERLNNTTVNDALASGDETNPLRRERMNSLTITISKKHAPEKEMELEKIRFGFSSLPSTPKPEVRVKNGSHTDRGPALSKMASSPR